MVAALSYSASTRSRTTSRSSGGTKSKIDRPMSDAASPAPSIAIAAGFPYTQTKPEWTSTGSGAMSCDVSQPHDNRPAEVVPLAEVDAHLARGLGRRGSLDAFDDHGAAGFLREALHVLHDAAAPRHALEVGAHRLRDLDVARADLVQPAHVRVAAAEVVEGEERAGRAQLLDVRERDLRRGDRPLLGDLDDDAAEAQAVLRRDAAETLREAARLERGRMDVEEEPLAVREQADGRVEGVAGEGELELRHPAAGQRGVEERGGRDLRAGRAGERRVAGNLRRRQREERLHGDVETVENAVNA